MLWRPTYNILVTARTWRTALRAPKYWYLSAVFLCRHRINVREHCARLQRWRHEMHFIFVSTLLSWPQITHCAEIPIASSHSAFLLQCLYQVLGPRSQTNMHLQKLHGSNFATSCDHIVILVNSPTCAKASTMMVILATRLDPALEARKNKSPSSSVRGRGTGALAARYRFNRFKTSSCIEARVRVRGPQSSTHVDANTLCLRLYASCNCNYGKFLARRITA